MLKILSLQGPPYLFAPLLTSFKISTSFQRISETNHTSKENPIRELLESGMKLHPGAFTKTRLESPMTDLLPI